MKIAKIMKIVGKLLFLKPYEIISASINRLGKKHKCYICGNTFSNFLSYKKGTLSIPPFIKELEMIGSDVDNFKCVFCTSHDRERHLCMFFDRLNLWQEFDNAMILHVAPERNLPMQIKRMKPAKYIMGDMNPNYGEVQKLDITNMNFSNCYFDFVICNHVLEHVLDHNKAMREIFRILKNGGKAILQTPFSTILKNTFADPNIDTDELRLRFYGETTHYRVYGSDFFDHLSNVGFKLNIIKNDKLFSRDECNYYGVNYKEDLVLVEKP
jgi:SAM-dependent methyltransferase